MMMRMRMRIMRRRSMIYVDGGGKRSRPSSPLNQVSKKAII
jgi:hypothetical protein